MCILYLLMCDVQVLCTCMCVHVCGVHVCCVHVCCVHVCGVHVCGVHVCWYVSHLLFHLSHQGQGNTWFP